MEGKITKIWLANDQKGIFSDSKFLWNFENTREIKPQFYSSHAITYTKWKH